MAELDYDKLVAAFDDRVAGVLSERLKPIAEVVVALDVRRLLDALVAKIRSDSGKSVEELEGCWDSPTESPVDSDSSPVSSYQNGVRTLRWSKLAPEDTVALFIAQNQLVAEHELLTKPHSSATFDDWKLVLGYPTDNAQRLEFIRNMPTYATKHGDRLHCLKLCDHREGKSDIVGFIEFEVKAFADDIAGNVREIYIRNLVVCPHLRGRGYGTLLYNGLLEYLSVGDVDVINLYVVDMNRSAINLYLKLGFKVTQWFTRRLEDETGFKAVFLCMQRMHGDAGCITLQEMPHLFKEEAVGEVVEILLEGGDSQKRRARIEAYDGSSQTFTIAYASAERNTFQQGRVDNVCLNDLFSRGYLSFERSAFRCLPRCSQVTVSSPEKPKDDLVSATNEQCADATSSSEHTEVDESMRGVSPRKRSPWPAAVLSPKCGESRKNPNCGEPRRKRMRSKVGSKATRGQKTLDESCVVPDIVSMIVDRCLVHK